MKSSLHRIAELLLLEQRRCDPSIDWLAATATDVPTALLMAAQAVRAGAPGRALTLLWQLGAGAVGLPSHDDRVVAAALASAAGAQEAIWLPGDVAKDALQRYSGPTSQELRDASPDAQLVAHLAALPERLFRTRTIIHEAGVQQSQTPETAERILTHGLLLFDASTKPILAHEWEPATAYLHSLRADLLWQAGRFEAADTLLRSVERVPDGAVSAHCHLLRGDWAVSSKNDVPPGGTRLDAVLRKPEHRGLADAREAWDKARHGYTRVDSRSGQAAALLRQSGDPEAGERERRYRRQDAFELARACGDDALAALIAMYQVTGRRVTEDEASPHTALAVIADWATGHGSAVYAGGLVQVMANTVGDLRRLGDLPAAGILLTDTRNLARRLGKQVESAVVEPAVRDLSTTDYHLLSLVHGLAGARADLVARSEPPALAAWLQHAVTFHRLIHQVLPTHDANLLEVVSEAFAPVLAGRPRGETSEPIPDLVVQVLADLKMVQQVLIPLFRGREYLRNGWLEDGVAAICAALHVAHSTIGDSAALHQVLALNSLGRHSEAADVARRLARTISPDLAARLLLNSGDAAGARQQLARLPQASAGVVANPEQPWEDLVLRSRIATALGEPADGARLADQAVAMLQERAARLNRDVLRSQSGDDGTVAEAYGAAVLAHTALAEASSDPSVRQSQVDAALSVADASRSALLPIAQAVREALADGTPRPLLKDWLQAGAEWPAAVERATRRLTQRREVDLPVLIAEAEAAEAALARAEAHLRRAAPEVLRRRSQPVTGLAAEVRAALPPDTVLLEYHLTPETLTIITLTTSSASAVTRTISVIEVMGRIARLYDACTSLREADADDLSSLSDLLLGPAATALADHRRVIVVPHRQLGQVPFASLPVPGSGEALDVAHVTSLLPSSGLVPVLARRSRTPDLTRGALVVGDPASAPGRGLERLPHAQAEARVCAALLGTEPLLAERATRDAVMSGAEGRSVVHLAAHGVLDPDRPHLAHLVLSGTDELSLGDLLTTVLGSELVVLSACRSGEGRPTVSGEIVGLSRAVLVAGAAHVVATLGRVDDRLTCEFMTELMKHVVSGDGVANAAHAARARLRAQSKVSGPFWASFVVFGL
jgi:CHAT domain-containing protein